MTEQKALKEDLTDLALSPPLLLLLLFFLFSFSRPKFDRPWTKIDCAPKRWIERRPPFKGTLWLLSSFTVFVATSKNDLSLEADVGNLSMAALRRQNLGVGPNSSLFSQFLVGRSYPT